VIVLTEETLEDAGIGQFMACVRSQPAWSDIPILLFSDAERSDVYLRTLRSLEGLRNVVLLERPIRLGVALSFMWSAIRGRDRQYELRDRLADLAAAREEADRANHLKDEFLATLSHELRTPLNAILGWTTMLRDGNVQQKHVMRALDTIHRNATAQVQIVNDLLDVSRIIRGNMQMAPRVLELAPVLTLALESMMPTAEAKGVSLALFTSDESVHVWGDPDRLQQVFWNLLSNAVKFTPSGGRVEISVEICPPDVRIQITDTGTGIASSFLPHVFDRFRQSDGSPTRRHGGLGLGLSIVRHLVELHGGRVGAESAGEGRGATFSVFLPVRPAETRAPIQIVPHVRRFPSHGLDLSGVQVLIVDDEADARDLLKMMLADTGAQIREASSAAEAIQMVESDPPDILLSDVGMPVRDGYSMMRAIRALPDGHLVRAIAVSAYARAEDKQRAYHAGFNNHVSKPVQPDALLGTIERLWLGTADSFQSPHRQDKVH